MSKGRHRRSRATRTTLTAGLIAALALASASCSANTDTDPEPEPPRPTQSTQQPSQEPEPSPEPEFDTSAHSIDDPESIWVVSNKLRALDPPEFAPSDLVLPEGVENEFNQPLREPAARAAEALHAAAAEEGVYFRIISAYRDYNTQVSLYNGYVARDGAEAADTYSARPGHSEHQTGLVIDIDDNTGCYLMACFADTEAGQWMVEHGAEYGFIVRYPEGATDITGFTYEPWHLRYVGEELALEMQRTGIETLEEFFDLPPAPDYAPAD